MFSGGTYTADATVSSLLGSRLLPPAGGTSAPADICCESVRGGRGVGGGTPRVTVSRCGVERVFTRTGGENGITHVLIWRRLLEKGTPQEEIVVRFRLMTKEKFPQQL